ncbi:MAG TPA: GAF domain-containing protein [Phenylobacterium sp.]|jgi:GAF domain-containing protein
MDIQRPKARLGWRIAAVVGALYALFVAAQDVDWLASFAGLTEHGDYGTNLEPTPELGLARIIGVTPGLPFAAAGIVAGDMVRLREPLWKSRRVVEVGERIHVTVMHGRQKRDVILTAVASRAPAQPGNVRDQVLSDLAFLPAVLLGFFVLVRSRARPVAVLLGVALASFGLLYPIPGPILSWLPTYPLVLVMNLGSAVIEYAAFLAFGLTLLDSVDGGRRWRWIAFAIAASGLVVDRAMFAALLFGIRGPGPALLLGPQLAVSMLSLAGTAICLLAAWRRSAAAEKRRFALLALAFGCIIVNQAWYIAMGVLSLGGELLGSWATQVANVLAGVIAPVIFTYAVLRHRILDLGFALNRTLVFSAVSAILLAAFGLTEWAVDHFVKIEGRERNALIDAAIALAVFLTFHRVRDFVEHAVEALFFRDWQEKEADLRRFVADAAFVTRRDALMTGFVGALSRFAGGADVAVYMKAADGRFARAAGDLRDAPRTLDPDDPALVRLRAERKPVEPDTAGSALPAALACPLLHRDEVIGAVLIASREAGDAFRPDEIDLLGWAARQVGADLHALEVEQLQAAVSRLEHQLEGARLAARPA